MVVVLPKQANKARHCRNCYTDCCICTYIKGYQRFAQGLDPPTPGVTKVTNAGPWQTHPPKGYLGNLFARETFPYRLRALEGLKAALTTAPVLAAPDFSKPWILLTDCSDTTMGACLAQLDEHGIERPVAYASCNLSTAQKNYGITDKEGLAIMWAVTSCTVAPHW
jgi:hypothetical protein